MFESLVGNILWNRVHVLTRAKPHCDGRALLLWTCRWTNVCVRENGRVNKNVGAGTITRHVCAHVRQYDRLRSSLFFYFFFFIHFVMESLGRTWWGWLYPISRTQHPEGDRAMARACANTSVRSYAQVRPFERSHARLSVSTSVTMLVCTCIPQVHRGARSYETSAYEISKGGTLTLPPEVSKFVGTGC